MLSGAAKHLQIKEQGELVELGQDIVTGMSFEVLLRFLSEKEEKIL